MPGTKVSEDNNLFYFSIGDVSFFALNFDYYKENVKIQ